MQSSITDNGETTFAVLPQLCSLPCSLPCMASAAVSPQVRLVGFGGDP